MNRSKLLSEAQPSLSILKRAELDASEGLFPDIVTTYHQVYYLQSAISTRGPNVLLKQDVSDKAI